MDNNARQIEKTTGIEGQYPNNSIFEKFKIVGKHTKSI